MKILLFGATGMVGRGVLRECLLATDVSEVVVIGRTGVVDTNPKMRQVVLSDPSALANVRATWTGAQACFFCLGVSAAGLSEEVYSRLSYDLTMSIATQLAEDSPDMVFAYVSGRGTDSSEQGPSMWARVKGRTENGLMRLPFSGVYLLRPGVILALDGIVSKTPLYRWTYRLVGPVVWLIHKFAPQRVVTTRDMGRAMLNMARAGAGRQVVEAEAIKTLANTGARAT